MLLRAYALTMGLRKDRRVLTTAVTTMKQMNRDLGGKGAATEEAVG